MPQRFSFVHRLFSFAEMAARSLILPLALIMFAGVAVGAPPAPYGTLSKGADRSLNAEPLLRGWLGVPYRVDGADDEFGNHTLFARPEVRFPTSGFNCSGFVLEASRYLLVRNITLAESKRDRLGDSGPGSAHGEDWDFGWDLIMNISEGLPRVFLLPDGKTADPAKATGFTPRGYDIHDPATWRDLPPRLTAGRLYLVTINVESRRKGYGLQHYHVGLIHVTDAGNAWFYHTTGGSKKVVRLDLSTPDGRAAFRKSFANNARTRKMALVLAVTPPPLSSPLFR